MPRVIGEGLRWLGRFAAPAGAIALTSQGIWLAVPKADQAGWFQTSGGKLFAFLVFVALFGTLIEVLESVNVERLRKHAASVGRQNVQLQGQLNKTKLEVDERDDDIAQLEADIRELFEAQLHSLAQRLEFNKKHRISVFARHGDTIEMTARYASNPSFHESPGRTLYPLHEGCIGQAFADGESVVQDLPDPKRRFPQYCQDMFDKFSIPPEVTKAFTMKSRSYAAFCLDDEDGHSVAVIVFESTAANDLNVEQLRGQLTSDTLRIRKFLKKRRPAVAKLAYARQKGV